MIRWFFKYSLLLFVINTILLSIQATYNLGYQIFLIIMGVFTVLLVFNPIQIKNILFHKSFSFLLILNIINIIYFLLLHNIFDMDAFKYLIARAIQFSIISVSVFSNFDL